MEKAELIKRLAELEGEDTLPVLVRGSMIIGVITNVYIDHDHEDDSPFVAIDVEGFRYRDESDI